MKLVRKMPAVAVAVVAATILAGCSGGKPDAEAKVITEFPAKWSEPITIDVFDSLANYMGMQEGWFAKIVEEKFNMKLNIIAPNVAGGGDTLYNTRVTSGDLGDLIIVDRGTKLDELIEGGLAADMTPYYGAMKSVAAYDTAVQHANEGLGGLYGIPTSVSAIKPTEPSEGLDPTFGPFVRWDLYADQGYPQAEHPRGPAARPEEDAGRQPDGRQR
ncbi:hypothetical protein [Cellulomonas soli]